MEYEKRIEWFKNARFGMFIHFGLYSIPARGEWVRSTERISVEDYQIYFDEFNPVRYDPKEWARMAKDAGMKYAVLTAKHHDGFCLFDTEYTEYKVTNTPYGEDMLRMYADAFRAEGIKVGFYYSLLDWYHPDYPHFGDRIHPMRDNEAFKDRVHNFDNYLDYMHKQVRELCTNYGTIDLLWFDFSYGEMTGEKWRASELVKMVRSLQPNVLIDNRLEVSGEGFGSLMTGNPTVYSGDFVSPEQIIPPDGIRDINGKPVCWEACFTMNNNWGYSMYDDDYKSPKVLIRKLVECVSKGGNVLLNVGPDAMGEIPLESRQILSGIAVWMEKNGESIYNCGISGFQKPEWGYITQNGKNIYLHVFDQPIGPIPLKGLKPSDVAFIRRLYDGAEIKPAETWTTGNYPDYLFIPLGGSPAASYALPDSTDTVIKIVLK